MYLIQLKAIVLTPVSEGKETPPHVQSGWPLIRFSNSSALVDWHNLDESKFLSTVSVVLLVTLVLYLYLMGLIKWMTLVVCPAYQTLTRVGHVTTATVTSLVLRLSEVAVAVRVSLNVSPDTALTITSRCPPIPRLCRLRELPSIT